MSTDVEAAGGGYDSSVSRGEWWRAVLGEYPTGVSLVTSAEATGEPVGMVVGSFVAISQDPPLVGFFGDDGSESFERILQTGRFAVSVLGGAHESLSRSFARKDPEAFRCSPFAITSGGLLRVGDAVAWFEGTVVEVRQFGDHRLVVGGVDDFGVGSANAGLPLIYRRGGYGSFALQRDTFDAKAIADRLAAAESAATALAEVARELDRDIAITTVVGDSVVVLAMVPAQPPGGTGAAGVGGNDPFRPIGVAFPFAAPVEPLFAAWAPERERSGWIEQSRHLVGSVDRTRLGALLTAVRRRGYAVSVDGDLTTRFYRLVNDEGAERESYARVWSEFAAQTVETVDGAGELSDVAAIEVPVFDATGQVVLGLNVSNLDHVLEPVAVQDFAARLLRAAEAVEEELLARARR